MRTIAEIFANNLRRLRKSKRLSQQALAERVGISVITVQNYEGMRRWPAPESIHDLARSLAVPESEFFMDTERGLSAEQVVLAVSEALRVPIELENDAGQVKRLTQSPRKSRAKR